MGGTKIYPVNAESSRWNTLLCMVYDGQCIRDHAHQSQTNIYYNYNQP